MTKSAKLYVILCSIFCVIVVSGNLVFQKFASFKIIGYSFEISVGILFYPFTFLISDIITEFYGELYAKLMVKIAIFCSVIIMILIYASSKLEATSWSIINNDDFDKMFNIYGVAAISSLFANYLGQLVDIKVYAYLKRLSLKKYLWFRNNMSTILGQLTDTLIIISLLSLFRIMPLEQYLVVAMSSLSFKIITSIIDTPFFYISYYLLDKYIFDKTKYSSVISGKNSLVNG